MSEEEPQPIQYPGLNEAVAAAVAQALANAGALQPVAQAPEGPALFMTSTPILGLRKPDIDDPALVSDLNFNMDILDGSITATGAATLTNKTLTAPVITNPTITGWTNAQHNHLNPAGAGLLDGAAIGSGYLGTGNLLRETALTDGSFSGLLLTGPTLLDPIVRTTLWWGPTGTGTPDASLARLAANSLALFGDISLTRIAPANLRVSGGNTPTIGMRAERAGITTSGKLLTTGDSAMLGWNLRLDAAGAVWMREDITKKSALLVQEGNAALIVYGTDAGPTPSLPDDPIAWGLMAYFDYKGRLGLATAPVNHHQPMLQIGQGLFTGAGWAHNSYYDGTNNRAIVSGLGLSITANGGEFHVYNAANVAAGAIQNFVERFTVWSNGSVVIATAGPGLGIGTQNLPWHPNYRAIDGPGGSVAWDASAGNRMELISNSYIGTDGNLKATVGTIWGCKIQLYGGGFYFHQYPIVASGATQTQRTRMTMNTAGGVILSCDTGTNPLQCSVAGTGALIIAEGISTATNPRLYCGPGSLELDPATKYVTGPTNATHFLGANSLRWGGIAVDSITTAGNLYMRPVGSVIFSAAASYASPEVDAGQNLGYPGSGRWANLYIYYAPTVGSHASIKTDFKPLDPAACADAVLETDWIEYTYRVPVPAPAIAEVLRVEDDVLEAEAKAEDEAPNDDLGKLAGKAAHRLAMKKGYLESLAVTEFSRHQKGYALGHDTYKVSELFGLPDRASRSDGADLAVVACALQGALQRIAQLEAAGAPAPTSTRRKAS